MSALVRPRSEPRLAGYAFALAALVALASAAGVWSPQVYAQETVSWATQGQAQDLFDLLVVAPLLAACGVALRRGSRTGLIVFGGATVYTLYAFVLYAFAMHFNVLFLVYCATLGTSFFAAIELWRRLAREDGATWWRRRAPLRLLGGLLIGQAVAFYALWLGAVVPALIAGEPPAELAAVGLATNPVWVLDLSIVLPAMMIAGLGALRRRGPACFLAPIMTGFAVLMASAIAAMMIAMVQRDLAPDLSVAIAMLIVAAVSAGALVAFLRRPSASTDAG